MAQRPSWFPRTRPPFSGSAFRYIPHVGVDPTDGQYSMREGGRWNAPGSFLVVYTSCSREVAIANLWHKYAGESFQPWQVSEERQADLFELEITQDGLIDIVSQPGVAGVGLPAVYPEGVSHAAMQHVGQRLYDDGRPGIWCISAVLPKGREIALFTEYSNPPTAIRGPERLWEWFPIPPE